MAMVQAIFESCNERQMDKKVPGELLPDLERCQQQIIFYQNKNCITHYILYTYFSRRKYIVLPSAECLALKIIAQNVVSIYYYFSLILF